MRLLHPLVLLLFTAITVASSVTPRTDTTTSIPDLAYTDGPLTLGDYVVHVLRSFGKGILGMFDKKKGHGSSAQTTERASHTSEQVDATTSTTSKSTAVTSSQKGISTTASNAVAAGAGATSPHPTTAHTTAEKHSSTKASSASPSSSACAQATGVTKSHVYSIHPKKNYFDKQLKSFKERIAKPQYSCSNRLLDNGGSLKKYFFVWIDPETVKVFQGFKPKEIDNIRKETDFDPMEPDAKSGANGTVAKILEEWNGPKSAKSKRASVISSHVRRVPTDTDSVKSWGLDRISIGQNGPLDLTNPPLNSFKYPSAAGEGVYIYVIDSSVGASPPDDIKGRVVDYIKSDWVTDADTPSNDHGQAVAVVAAGEELGVARKARIISVVVFPVDKSLAPEKSDNEMKILTVVSGLRKAREDHLSKRKGRKAVFNVSIVLPYGHPDIETEVKECTAAGIAVVICAGNMQEMASLPGAKSGMSRDYQHTLVGASNIGDAISSFSNWGAGVHINAPGEDVSVLKAPDGGYMWRSGTSYATPYVSGVYALLLSVNSDLTPRQLRDAVLAVSGWTWCARSNAWVPLLQMKGLWP